MFAGFAATEQLINKQILCFHHLLLSSHFRYMIQVFITTKICFATQKVAKNCSHLRLNRLQVACEKEYNGIKNFDSISYFPNCFSKRDFQNFKIFGRLHHFSF